MVNKVTQKTIAELAGVSIGTVDRALNNRGRINEETKRKVIKVAKEQNYKPNNIARALVMNKPITIAAVFPEKPEYFFSKIENGMQAAKDELKDYNVLIEFLFTESLNPAKQEEVLKSIDIKKYDGILVAAGGESIQKYIDAIANSNVPIATFNADVQSSKRLFFVGQDSMRAGSIAGELMGKFTGGKGKVAVLTGFSSVLSHQERHLGFVNAIQQNFKDIELMGPYEYYDMDDHAYAVAKRVLEEHKNLDGIYVTSAPGAVGSGSAIKDMGLSKKPLLIGFDINDVVKRFLKEGICSAIIFQDPFMQAYYATKLLAKNILEDWHPAQKNMYIRSKIVLKENVDEYHSEHDNDRSFLDILIE